MAFIKLRGKEKYHALYFFLLIIYIFFLTYFYYVYVPLIPAYQFALAPLIFIVFALTLVRIEWGLLAFIFLFPLINILPYLFNIFEHIPHAPASLVIFLFFFLGWLLRRCLVSSEGMALFHPLNPILTLYLLLILLSSLITFLRYGNFSPFLTGGWPELVVNADGVRAGGARMSVVFSGLNLISGLIFSIILFPYLKEKKFKLKALKILLASFFISLVYGLFQFFSESTMARPYLWIALKQYQSTYKDPNAFAFYLSAFLPLILAMFIAPKKRRWLSVVLFSLSFICLAASGTRIALLSSFVGFIFVLTFSLKFSSIPRWQKMVLMVSLLLVIGAAISVLVLFFPSALAWRLNRSWFYLRTGFLNELFSGKITLWRVALAMFRDFPISGVGIGAYIVELPNYLIKSKLAPVPSDSAENAFFQILAELGILGVIIVLILSFKFLNEAKRNWRLLDEQEDRILLVGFTGSLLACLINFMFHSYIGSFETKYLFWFIATWILACSLKSPEKADFSSKQPISKFLFYFPDKPRALKLGAMVILILFASSHFFNSLTSLSIPRRTKEFGWKQDFGFYNWEKDWRGFNFRWAKKKAGLTIEQLGPKSILPLLASHPDIEKNPVKVKIYLADDWFRKKRELYSLELKTKEWQLIEIPLVDLKDLNESISSDPKFISPVKFFKKGESQGINLLLETNRDWNPGRVLKIPDPRNIACAVGQIWYKYPPLKSEDSIVILKTIAASEWMGSQKNQLASNGSAELTFFIEEERSYLRLQVRGQKAAGLGPLLELYLDNQLKARTILDNEEWTYLYLHKALNPGFHRLKIEFLNDYYAPSLELDRNLFLGSVEIIR
jgi:O-antigen ligase